MWVEFVRWIQDLLDAGLDHAASLRLGHVPLLFFRQTLHLRLYALFQSVTVRGFGLRVEASVLGLCESGKVKQCPRSRIVSMPWWSESVS